VLSKEVLFLPLSINLNAYDNNFSDFPGEYHFTCLVDDAPTYPRDLSHEPTRAFGPHTLLSAPSPQADNIPVVTSETLALEEKIRQAEAHFHEIVTPEFRLQHQDLWV
jgi:hypothetical protein